MAEPRAAAPGASAPPAPRGLGELVQIDGSEHRWIKDRGPVCTLLVFIDDATSRLMQMRFVPSETTQAYFAGLQDYLQTHGRPVALAIVLGPMADMSRYSDKHSVFRVNRAEARTGHGMTQFGRALCALNIEIICANSSQAKGRVERANRAGRGVAFAGMRDLAAANAFLPGFIAAHNLRFALTPARAEDRHRCRLSGVGGRLSEAVARKPKGERADTRPPCPVPASKATGSADLG